jgi:hypothetical protein
MNNGIVGDRHPAADNSFGLLVRAMDYGPVLDIRVVADRNGMNVSPDDGIEPDGAIVAHRHFAHHNGPVGQETVLPKNRRKATYRFNNCHTDKMSS